MGYRLCVVSIICSWACCIGGLSGGIIVPRPGSIVPVPKYFGYGGDLSLIADGVPDISESATSDMPCERVRLHD